MTEPTHPPKKMPLGFKILIGILIGNVLLMIGLVLLSEQNKPELVDENYYINGNLDSVKLTARENAKSGWKPIIQCNGVDSGATEIRIWLNVSPADTASMLGVTGTIALFRPSGKQWDRRSILLKPDRRWFFTAHFEPELEHGRWLAQLDLRSTTGKHFKDQIAFEYKPSALGNK